MANTYTQIHIHVVFVVKNRESLIRKAWKAELYKYITGIVQQHGHKVLAINGVEDHVHLFFGMRPVQSLSKLMQDVKGSSAKWVNQQTWMRGRFNWQPGYGAFSYGKSQVSAVVRYIQRQEEHHTKRSFREEYVALLKKFEVDFDEQYIFHSI